MTTDTQLAPAVHCQESEGTLMTTTTTSCAADLLTLIEAYAEARHCKGHSSYNAQTAAALQAVKDALAAGQATAAQAGEYPALVCDYCGALTPDPWHSSGMLHGKMSKHIHSCDACASHGQAPAPAAVAGFERGWDAARKQGANHG